MIAGSLFLFVLFTHEPNMDPVSQTTVHIYTKKTA